MSSTDNGWTVYTLFCPRSIMLYILHMGNHPDISYKGGQQPIVHLQADFHKVIDWNAVLSSDFRDPKIKEGKQAGFLMFDVFP